MQISYVIGKEELLNEVKPLWERLNEHHKNKTTYFYDKFNKFTFDKRMNGLLEEDIEVSIIIARNENINLNVGYCITTINKNDMGEIQSIFIDKEYRKYGIGEELMDRALNFLNERNIEKIIVGVAEGNEEAIGFYEKFGFRKRTTILERI